MIGRVEMMRLAMVEATAILCGSLVVRDPEVLAVEMTHALDAIVEPYRRLDPTFVADFDWSPPRDDVQVGRHCAIILSNAQGSLLVPMIWSARAVRLGTGFNSVVPLAAPVAGKRLVKEIEAVVTAFYDRNQPRAKQTPREAQGVFADMRKG